IRRHDERPIEVVGEHRGHPRWHLRYKFCPRRDVRVGRQHRGNFAYTICGLARGTDWLECSRTFSAQLSELGAEHGRQVVLWDEALRSIRAHPSIFVGRLRDGIAAYVTSIPRFFLVQYVPLFWPQRETVRWIVLALIPGWIFLMTRRERSRDILFFLI